MNSLELLHRAIAFAGEMHRGQTDKAGRPYIEHPLRVMWRLSGWDRVGQIVAVLHDVLEDTDADVHDLRMIGLDTEIINAIDAITRDDGEPVDRYLDRVRANPIALRVKRADIADNADEARLQLIDTATADRLRKKYQRALVALGSQP